MNITANNIYHIYNQGNNQERIFFGETDYVNFLELFRKYVSPYCKVLAYCLMPNHFHFEIYATTDAATVKRIGNINTCMLSNGFRLLQSSYALQFNKRQNRTGSLFRQKAKAKAINDGTTNYGYIAFNYIHQNPLNAKLVAKIEDWKYSSFPDYAGVRNGCLCDQELAWQLIDFNKDTFVADSYNLVDDEAGRKIFIKEDFI